MTTVHWGSRDLLAHLDEVLDVYATAMGYPPEVTELRRGFVAAHTQRAEFRAVATVQAGRVVGFGYGYRSRPGQWWHEQVRVGLDEPTYAKWMTDCFELVELHVMPWAQGRGSGQAQLAALLDGVHRRTVALSTPEGESRAWRLYRRLGFVDLLRDYDFPGDDRPFAVLARDLPLDPPHA